MILQQLITFCRVVETGGFTRAGELMNLSQPAVTRQVAALEADLGTELLDRQGRHLHVTPAGQVVYDYARRIAARVEQCRNEVSALSQPGQGEVTIATVTVVGLFTLPQLLHNFSTLYPGVRYRVWSGRVARVMDLVLDGEAAVGLVTMPVTHPRLDSVPLFKDPVIVVTSPDHVQGLPQPLSLEQFSQLEMISFEAPSRFRTQVEAALEQVGLYPRVTMEFDSHEAVNTMARMGYGVAMVPRSSVARELEEGSLVELQVTGLPPISRTTSMLLRREHPPRRPAEAEFIRLITDRYGGATEV